MQWFKHDNNFRNSPQMKYIQRRLGDRGFAAAMRVLEVMCERCGSGEKYNPVLILAPPTSKRWLGEEILTPADDEPGGFVRENEIDELLECFYEAGLITRGKVTGAGERKDDSGNWVHDPSLTFETISLAGFEQILDEWTARKRKNGKRGKPPTSPYADQHWAGLQTPK